MRKLLLMGCLCMGGLMLAGADGSCTITDERKKEEPQNPGGNPGGDPVDPAGNKTNDAEAVEFCKVDSIIGVRLYSCLDGYKWSGYTPEQQEKQIAEEQEWCETETEKDEVAKDYQDAMGDYGCTTSLDVASFEACADAMSNVVSLGCEAVLTVYDACEFKCSEK